MLSRCGRALKDFLRCVVAEYHHAPVICEIALIEVAPIREIEFAHLAIGHIHAAHLQGHHAGPDLEPEIAVNLSAYRPHDGHFVANCFHVLQFVLDCLARPLAASLHAGLSRPDHDDVVAHVQKRVQHAPAQALTIRQQ